MNKTFLKTTGLTATSILLLSGCATSTMMTNKIAAGDIVADSVRLNEAINKSTNAIILKNILRARDRWPRSYTTISGISSEPVVGFDPSFDKLAPIGLSGANGPFKTSEGSVGVSTTTTKSYTVNPFAEGKRTESLLTSLDTTTFERYYKRWPKDVVLLLFVSEFTAKDGGGKINVSTFNNEGDGFEADASKHTKLDKYLEAIYGKNVDFKRDFEFGPSRVKARLLGLEERSKTATGSAKQNILRQITQLKAEMNDSAVQKEQKNCAKSELNPKDFLSNKNGKIENLEKLSGLTKAKVTIEENPASGFINLQICKPAKKVNKVLRFKNPDANNPAHYRELHLTFRSFEDMVYYVGESIREENKGPKVEGPCEEDVPLFKLSDKNALSPHAAKVEHAGKIYKAMPSPNPCGSEGAPDSRTGTVLALLNQLLLLNQSEEFLKAPQIINR